MTIEQFLQESLQNGPVKKQTLFQYFVEGLKFGVISIKNLAVTLFDPKKKAIDKISNLVVLGFICWLGYNSPYAVSETDEFAYKTFIFIGNLLFYAIGVLLLLRVYQLVSKESRFVRSIKRQYKRNQFSWQEIATAADTLRIWRSIGYEKAIKKFPKRIVDLLIIAGSVRPCINMKRKLTLQRIVSIKAIEEDREAGWEE